MNEQQRFNFLINRDGIDSAIAWELRTAEQYEIAANKALDPYSVGGVKGAAWANIYRQAAEQCLEVVVQFENLR